MGKGDRSTLAVGYRYPMSDVRCSMRRAVRQPAATCGNRVAQGVLAVGWIKDLARVLRSFCAGRAVRVLQKGKRHERYQDLSGSRCVAGGDGLVREHLQAHAGVPGHGAVRPDFAVAAFVGVDSVQHCGRAGSRDGGVRAAFPAGRDRIGGGSRHSTRARPKTAVRDRRRDARDRRPTRTGAPNALRHAPRAPATTCEDGRASWLSPACPLCHDSLLG